jgi:CheY-like chemotaxis protein
MVPSRPNQSRATVLVIEDSPEVQRYLRLLLELDYYHVEIASNGEEALARIEQGCTPELVLLDMQMPGMDGLQTLQSLMHLQPGLKVIICSAEDHPDTIRQAILLGAQAYLVKPVPRLYLSAAVEGCLARSRSQTATCFIRPSRTVERLN